MNSFRVDSVLLQFHSLSGGYRWAQPGGLQNRRQVGWIVGAEAGQGGLHALGAHVSS